MATYSQNKPRPYGEMMCAHPRAAAILSAVAATLAIWIISVFVGQVDLTVSGSREVGPIAVVAATLVAGLVGAGLLALLERFTSRAWSIWLGIALVTFVVSLLGPLSAETVNGRTTLSIMHAVTAAILIKGFSGTVRRT